MRVATAIHTLTTFLRGRVRLTAYRRGGSRAVRTFTLPLSRRASLFPRHPHRRGGAVFGDEVGESIVGRSYASVVRRFGPPAAVERSREQRCIYYEVVGDGPFGWRLCFGAGGRLTSAGGALALAGLSETTHHIFQATGLHKLFNFYPDPARAIAALGE